MTTACCPQDPVLTWADSGQVLSRGPSRDTEDAPNPHTQRLQASSGNLSGFCAFDS